MRDPFMPILRIAALLIKKPWLLRVPGADHCLRL
jgi:hypothetical protein